MRAVHDNTALPLLMSRPLSGNGRAVWYVPHRPMPTAHLKTVFCRLLI